MGIALSLMAALCWGVADFLAAFVSRRIGSVRALLVTQSLELILIAVFLAAHGTLLVASPQVWAWGLGMGIVQCVGVLMLYRAFEIGTLSIVAPLASSFVIFTALFARWGGERTPLPALGGAGLLFVGVCLATYAPPKNASGAARAGIGLALAAAICIALVFWQFGAMVERSAPLWPALPLRLCTVVGAMLVLAVARPALPVRASPKDNRLALWATIGGVSLTNCLAWLSFNAALEFASTTVVAALSSLFAAVTVFMAWLFLKECLNGVQWVGVAVILLGVLTVGL